MITGKVWNGSNESEAGGCGYVLIRIGLQTAPRFTTICIISDLHLFLSYNNVVRDYLEVSRCNVAKFVI